MSDLPGYEPTAVESPKKPRRKPVKKRRKVKVVAPVVKRKKRRQIKTGLGAAFKKPPVILANPFTPEMYRLIGELLALDDPNRNIIFEVVRGLTK